MIKYNFFTIFAKAILTELAHHNILYRRMEKDLFFQHLFKQHYEPLFLFARQMVSSEEECHDIVSDAFEEVWSKMEHVKEQTVRAYLYTTVRNRCINYLRHQQVRQQYISYCEKITATYTKPDDLIEQTERDRLVERAISELKPPTDVAIKLYANGKKYREIAEEMNLTMSYVKKIISHGVAQIKEYIVKNV